MFALYVAISVVAVHCGVRAQPHSGSGEQVGSPERIADREVFWRLRCMCGECARLPLSSCPCKSAEHTRDIIRAKLKAGSTVEQVVAEYAAKYGVEALTERPRHPEYWLVVGMGVALGAIGIWGLKMRRARRERLRET
jgi:cytochrome c-type biogenesis protein CcmH/NrfF